VMDDAMGTREAIAAPDVVATNDRPRRRGRRAKSWRDVREEAGLSLRDLQERSGIHRGELSKIERGRSCPTPEQASAILCALMGSPS
jgi:ribosome-binding protein aMBF1 (putative translation factor)